MKYIFCISLLLFNVFINADDIDHIIGFGINFNYFDYSEDVPEGLKSDETGFCPEINFSYKIINKTRKIINNLNVGFALFDTDYDGTTQAGDPVKAETENVFFDFEDRVGFVFYLDHIKKLSLIPFTGAGLHYWNRDLGQYSEDYSWAYIPIGLINEIILNKKLYLEGSACIRLMINGKIKINFSDIDPANPDIKLSLGNKPGYFFSTGLNYKINDSFSFYTYAWFHYSEIGKSNSAFVTDGFNIYEIYEPASRTFQYGINVIFSYLISAK